MEISLLNHMVCWKPSTKEVKLFSHPGDETSRGWSSIGACDSRYKRASFRVRQTLIFMDAMHLVVRDGIDPIKLSAVLENLKEYRDGLAIDYPLQTQSAKTLRNNEREL
jgi:hypothetical protein